MDLTQDKLSRKEWTNLETPVSEKEQIILQTITNGFYDPDIHYNPNQSLIQMIKIENTPALEYSLYDQYLKPEIQKMTATPKKGKPLQSIPSSLLQYSPSGSSAKFKLKTADKIRLKNMEEKIEKNKLVIFEFVLIDFCHSIFKSLNEKNNRYIFYLYTLIQLKKATIQGINKYIQEFVNMLIDHLSQTTNIETIVYHSYEFIEKNPYLIQYEDLTLFSHQKELFQLFQDNSPKLVLYTAPTGTGKTLSPIGLAQKYRVIFVCVARHIGLALAKSAISIGKKVAFAFGCETATDIRLHYFAAAVYTKHHKSGGIGKVDNSIGTKVEIMICDVKSYLIAMHYMLAFHDEQTIITYWDEPTITMDSETHELHEQIHTNWTNNKISQLVLSCATLPAQSEIMTTINDFQMKFSDVVRFDLGNKNAEKEKDKKKYNKRKCKKIRDDVEVEEEQEQLEAEEEKQESQEREDESPHDDEEEKEEKIPLTYKTATVHSIHSYDCKKTISLLNSKRNCVLPHLLFRKYGELLECVSHCKKNKTLLRYFDLVEIIRFIQYVITNNMLDPLFSINRYFNSITDVTMNSLKLYYLIILENIDSSMWEQCYIYMTSTQTNKYIHHKDEPFRKIKSDSIANTILKEKPLTRMHSMDISSVIPTPVITPETGILLTTIDAHTLTDGPTIYLTEDVEQMGEFYIRQTNLPESEFMRIMERIERNNRIQEKIEILEKDMEDKLGKELEKEKKMENEVFTTKNTKTIMEKINQLRCAIQNINMNPKYIPNKQEHQIIWNPTGEINKSSFTSKIDESDVKNIMLLNVDNNKKILLLLGIGIFKKDENIHYAELMKKLAYQQKLFLIIASSDYIYGTNYQFCHGFIGGDLTNMTQQKTIQAMGRIGRNNIQNEYTVRFCNDDILMRLFLPMEYNLEAINMSQLFMS
jgi:hypothetical protein